MDFYNITIGDDDLFDKFLKNVLAEHNYKERVEFIMHVATCIIISIGLPLIFVAIYALYSLVRNGQVAPIYVINLLISDIIQLCCMIALEAGLKDQKPSTQLMLIKIVSYIHEYSLLTSVGFMVCFALERYLAIAWPLWYRFRRTIKIPVMVCVVVWIFALVCLLTLYFLVKLEVSSTIFAILILLPLPLFIFLLGGTLKVLSASTVPSDEKRRIVGVLVLVLLIYTLLFMPKILWLLSEKLRSNFTFYYLSNLFLMLSPLADLFLYVFMRKGIIDKPLASVCCCRMDSNDISRSSGNDDNIHTVSSV